MQVFIQTASFAPLCNNGQVIFSHVAHKEQNINMPSLPNRKEQKKKLVSLQKVFSSSFENVFPSEGTYISGLKSKNKQFK